MRSMKSAGWFVRAITVTVALTCVGCSEEEAASPETCMEDNPAAGLDSFESDMWHIVCPAAPNTDPDVAPPVCEAPTIEEIEADCIADGYPCTAKIVVTREAALCIARDAGLSAGLEGLYADLAYSSRVHLPSWYVSNVLSDDGAGTTSGKSLKISAVDGTVAETSAWGAMP